MHKSTYFKILDKIDFSNKHRYYGSPAIAMSILGNEDTSFYFHDIEKEPLDNIVEFSINLGIRDKVTTYCGDSISAYLQDNYSFDCNDFIFIDPYTPFDKNETGKSFFDVFLKKYKSHSKTLLWYGYDNLNSKNDIIEKLQSISYEYAEAPIYTFDVWQKCMKQNSCKINPGVPGCGIAAANLSHESIQKIRDYLYHMGDLYSNVTYNGVDASLCTGKCKL